MGCNETVVRRKLITLSASKEKLERAYTGNLTTQLKDLEQKKAYTPKRSRQQEINNLRAKNDHIETKKPLKESTKPRAGSFRKSKILINP